MIQICLYLFLMYIYMLYYSYKMKLTNVPAFGSDLNSENTKHLLSFLLKYSVKVCWVVLQTRTFHVLPTLV